MDHKSYETTTNTKTENLEGFIDHEAHEPRHNSIPKDPKFILQDTGDSISETQSPEKEKSTQFLKQKALTELKRNVPTVRRNPRYSAESCLKKSLTFSGGSPPRTTPKRPARLSHQLWREEQHSRLYKVIVIGEVNTGKSALVRRYVHNFFGNGNDYRATLGVDFHLKLIHLNDEVEIRLQLWDIAGQERFCNMTRAYYKGAMGAFIVFDWTNANSFDAVKRWKQDLDTKCFTPEGGTIPAVLICNKADLPRDSRLPPDETISSFAKDYGFVDTWFQTSAKTGLGIKDAMHFMVRHIMSQDSWNLPLSSLEADEDSDLSLTHSSTTELPSSNSKPVRLEPSSPRLSPPTKPNRQTCLC